MFPLLYWASKKIEDLEAENYRLRCSQDRQRLCLTTRPGYRPYKKSSKKALSAIEDERFILDGIPSDDYFNLKPFLLEQIEKRKKKKKKSK